MKSLSLNNLLLSISYVLDYIDKDLVGISTNHSRRVAYISFAIAKQLEVSHEECFDLVALSILHGNGINDKSVRNNDMLDLKCKDNSSIDFKEHCIIGEDNIKDFPFLTNEKNIIKYHHERYDGSGLFGMKGDEIPIMAQIISFTNNLDNKFELKENYQEKENSIIEYVELKRDKWFSSEIADAFYKMVHLIGFQMDLKDNYIEIAVNRILTSFDENLKYCEARKVSKVFSKLIDNKSKFTSEHSQGLSTKVGIMADYYEKDRTEKTKLLIAADLHDLGKVTISNKILDKPDVLTNTEFRIIQTHSYHTRICLEPIDDFVEITKWASNHHEKLDGSGYPYGLTSKYLDFSSRLMACLDIYQALTENRPYREGFSHLESMDILKDMSYKGLIDKGIVEDIEYVFGSKQFYTFQAKVD